jgi:O-antigen/teichoic acid export membrane protein
MMAKARGALAPGGPLRALWARSRATTLASVYMLGSYALVALVGVVAIRVLTGLAAPAVFGEANLLLVSLQLAVTVVSQPFTTTQLRYHSAEVDAGRGDSFTRAILFWTCTASAGVSLLAVLSWLVMSRLQSSQLGLPGLGGMVLLVFATAFRSVVFGRFQAERRNFIYGTLLPIEALCTAGGAAIGLWISPTVNGYVLGQASGAAVSAFVGLAMDPGAAVRTLAGREPAPQVLKQVRAYGLPFAPMGILNWLANTADRYVLGLLAGPAAVGQYVAPFSIASRAMAVLGGAMSDIFRPALFQAANRNDKRATQRIFWMWQATRAATVVVALLGLMLFGPFISRLLLAPAYRAGATPILMWVAAGYGIQGMIQTVETRLMSLDRTRWLITPLAIGGLANLGFSFLLIPHFGAIGAGMATAFSFVVQSGLTLWRLRKAERLAAV